jgi:hypothetical protein
MVAALHLKTPKMTVTGLRTRRLACTYDIRREVGGLHRDHCLSRYTGRHSPR